MTKKSIILKRKRKNRNLKQNPTVIHRIHRWTSVKYYCTLCRNKKNYQFDQIYLLDIGIVELASDESQ